MIYRNDSRGALLALENDVLADCGAEEDEIRYCGRCGGEIYDSETLYEVASEYICSECIRDRLFDIYSEDYLIRRGGDEYDCE